MEWKLLTHMRNSILRAVLAGSLILAGSNCGFCQENGGPLGDPIPPPIQDPSLSSSPYFSPSLTNAGVAITGPALGLVKGADRRGSGCNVKNPCALPTPARDHAIAARAG
jgi:hypothetical protein